MVTLINSPIIQAAKITLKFYESSHTFMSVKSIHAGVEREMKRRPGGNVYDFCDFVEAVRSSNSRRMVVIEPKANEFRNWATLQYYYKVKYDAIQNFLK